MSYPGRVSTPEGYLGMNGLTATADFFRHQIHQPVKVDPALWSLQISSMEGGEASLTFDELLTLPKVSISNTIACAGVSGRNFHMGTALWTGVYVRDLFKSSGISTMGRFFHITALDGYVTYLSVDALEGAILAYGMNGEPLPIEHGYPVRLVVPGVYGYKMPKWIHQIRLQEHEPSGYWESKGWSSSGLVQTTSLILTPHHREEVSGTVLLSGVAYGGTRKIVKVEVSIDDSDWMPVNFDFAHPNCWTVWQTEWTPTAAGDYLIKVRATDDSGFTQSESAPESVFPNGSSAVHALIFRVVA